MRGEPALGLEHDDRPPLAGERHRRRHADDAAPDDGDVVRDRRHAMRLAGAVGEPARELGRGPAPELGVQAEDLQ